jgi:hypothetical protein
LVELILKSQGASRPAVGFDPQRHSFRPPRPPSPSTRLEILTNFLILNSFYPLGKNFELNDRAATGVEVRAGPIETSKTIQSYGVIDGGGETMRYAWSRLTHKFSVRRQSETAAFADLLPKPKPQIFVGHNRYRKDLLEKCPVDLLVVERGTFHHPPTSLESSPWENLVNTTTVSNRPKVVIEIWAPPAQLWNRGPMSKSCVSRWKAHDYITHCRLTKATSIGGAIQQDRLLITRVHKAYDESWRWDSNDRAPDVIRPMGNLLTPPGLVNPRHYVQHPSPDRLPNALRDPMPGRLGAFISTERGVRRLHPEETARGLGIPKNDSNKATSALLHRTTSVFHWEYLSASIAGLNFPDTPTPDTRSALRHAQRPSPSVEEALQANDSPDFQWAPPDLSEGGSWRATRLGNLERASNAYPNPGSIVEDGIRLLDIHRNNYNEKGPDPQWLQLLWWEFPEEHWEDLRVGARQNFLKTPLHHIQPNAPMDADMTQAAAEFVDELLSLGVVRDIEKGRSILSNAPLFVVPKEGQEGEWRVIADMLRGGQNECTGQDPVFMPRISHILDQMYTNGYSAVVDLSKFFYNFPTHAEDRPYLGLLHPISGKLYCYYGLPMGAGNSPALACRFGLAFIRMLEEQFEVFQGQSKANCYWTGFSATGFDPTLGYGYVLTGRDGGSVRIWVWVDDFLIHGPTYAKTAQALTFFLDTAVDCGFLFHPKKLVTPRQVVKYCGFLFDSRSIPCLRIPAPKRERAIAICDYLLDSPPTKNWSRLSLAVAAGVLESLSEATPRRLGHTHLRHFHSLVHPPGIGTGAAPYFTCTLLSAEVRQELSWWKDFLVLSEGRVVRLRHAATLVPTFGDGSGTGTGGTFKLPTDFKLQMWKGKWRPSVYHFPSVWKELATLEETLLRLRASADKATVHGTTVFYFTDNSGVYWIATNGSSRSLNLHKLIGRIRRLELELDCFLQVVHVPGLVLIDQGTDGLSRGVWMSSCQHLAEEDHLTRAIFAPLPFDRHLIEQYVSRLENHDGSWTYYHWDQPWQTRACLGKLTVWFPPPELAHQVLAFVLNTWMELPQATSGLFFIPRVMETNWRKLSRFLGEMDLIFPHTQQLHSPPVLPIPVVVLYLAPHHRSLTPPKRLERPADPPFSRWHRQQATHMRGLQGKLLPE